METTIIGVSENKMLFSLAYIRNAFFVLKSRFRRVCMMCVRMFVEATEIAKQTLKGGMIPPHAGLDLLRMR